MKIGHQSILKKMPERVAIIGADWPTYEKYCPNFLGMQDGLTRLGIEHKLFSCRPALSIDSIVQYNPDFLIYGLVDMVRHHAWRMEIRKRLPNAKIVMWYGDYRDNFTGQFPAVMDEIDMMFVSNDTQNDYYKQIWKVPECHFLPLGSPIFTPNYDPKFDFDFVFIGGIIAGVGFLDRAKTIWKYKKHGLTVLDGDTKHPELRAKIFKQMPTIYRSSKVVLDHSHYTDIKGYTSNRFWIVPASAGFALTKYWPGCEEFYPEGTRAYFRTFDESIELLDYFLKHPEARENIQFAGYEHSKNHTYDKRFDTMFSKVYASQEKKINNARIGIRYSGISP